MHDFLVLIEICEPQLKVNDCATEPYTYLTEIILFLLKQTLKINLGPRVLWVSSRCNPMKCLFVPTSVLITSIC